MKAFSQIDYLVIGHLSRDIVPGGYAPGGTVVYSALAAQALGYRAGVITSVDAAYDVESILGDIEIHLVTSERSTVFENIYDGGKRKQFLYSVAETIGADDVPPAWRRAPIVHLGPIAGEIASDIIRQFSNSLVGLTPQGWLRRWQEDGRVYAAEWPDAPDVFPLASAVITSPEDLPDTGYLAKLRQWCPLLVVTQGMEGCTVYSRGEERHFAAAATREVNATGAGDIFATAFLIRLRQTNGNLWEAAVFANDVAARTVGEGDLHAKIEAIKAYAQSHT